MPYLIVATSLAAFVLWLVVRLAQGAFRNLPRGPKGLPLIGDLQHAADQEWLASPQRKDEYGELMYLSVFGQGILVLNSQRVAVDLLDKRSNIYSDRPRYISFGDFLTQNLTFVFTGYGDLWRRFRRPAAEGFAKSIVQDFYPIQSREALLLALSLIKSPPTKKHFQRHAWSIILSINYHLPPVESLDDPNIVDVAHHVERGMKEIQPGARLVEYFPWMRYIPSRFAKWKRDAQYWFIQDSLRMERLLRKVADDLAKGIDRPSFGATLLKNHDKYHLSEREQAWLVGDMLTAGGETTSTSLHWWLLAILAYPEVQDRAHAELDEVVGFARPPTFADLPFLPYICAMVKETLRWAPLTPFSIPHASSADDWYEGMLIPKGTVILPNLRVINFDPAIYGDDSARFNPGRYLDENGQAKILVENREEGHMSFGHGRRVCPGRFVAEATLAIDFATLLWAMRFSRLEGAQGELDTRTVINSGVGGYPVPFECKANPRFAEAETLLKEALSLYE